MHPSNRIPTGLYRERRSLVGLVLGTRPGARALLAVGRARRTVRDRLAARRSAPQEEAAT
ncbi:hypothetical protein [Cellulosimicrobium sp. CUA-896]|uniref:hypothetical protein n=1 Tax=Cellulosimicrobium sp. CUA-896 TaxID=1517881 RepID=UPI0009651FF6|nr:hypothetical protein [Cellulosimicrobium sp. CUA-896]OLT55340.1 hypothetical protein BJF88_06905 [Cellulosimicrobium sp. CUA-896]